MNIVLQCYNLDFNHVNHLKIILSIKKLCITKITLQLKLKSSVQLAPLHQFTLGGKISRESSEPPEYANAYPTTVLCQVRLISSSSVMYPPGIYRWHICGPHILTESISAFVSTVIAFSTTMISGRTIAIWIFISPASAAGAATCWPPAETFQSQTLQVNRQNGPAGRFGYFLVVTCRIVARCWTRAKEVADSTPTHDVIKYIAGLTTHTTGARAFQTVVRLKTRRKMQCGEAKRVSKWV